jgi:hypothetical protein
VNYLRCLPLSTAIMEDIYDELDTMLDEGKFYECDKILLEAYVPDISLANCLAILTITSAWKSRLHYRDDFYKRVHTKAHKMMAAIDADKNLQGLQ